MSKLTIATFAFASLGVVAVSSQAVAACSHPYVPRHHTSSSNTVCVHSATILPGGPKLKAPSKPTLPAVRRHQSRSYSTRPRRAR